MTPKIFGSPERRRRRDLERLAFLEGLSRGTRRGVSAKIRPVGAKTPALARYTRFRQVGKLTIGLGLVCILFSLAGAFLSLLNLLRGQMPLLSGLGVLFLWLLGGIGLFGILKGLGELLFLLADIGELINSVTDALWEEADRDQGAGPQTK